LAKTQIFGAELWGHSGDEWMQEAVQKEKSRGGKKQFVPMENPWASPKNST